MPPDRDNLSTHVAALMILVASAVTIVFGIAAVGETETLAANVREIESTTGSEMYASLVTWGWILLALGAAEAAAAVGIWRRTPNRRLAAEIVSFLGLIGAFFTLPIVRLGSAAVAVLLLLAVYILAYRSDAKSPAEQQETLKG